MSQQGFFDYRHKNPGVSELQGHGDLHGSAMVDQLLKLSASPNSGKNFGGTSMPHPVLGTCQLCVPKIKQVPR